jgi:2,3-bisphosphoglycerate-independent phosphoglycerate mutase
MNSNKVALVIMDGWGHGPDNSCNAIAQAHTPFIDSLYKRFPNAELLTSGENVGLPEGQMGNSEVGHLNLGAGRIVYQELGKINKAVRERTLDTNPVLLEALMQAKVPGRKLHLMGLVSDGGVHSHISHLKGLCRIAQEHGLENVFIHAFLDGRDTDPRAGAGYLEDLEQSLASSTGRIASVVGRYYAMDRDKRWERVKVAYDLLTKGQGKPSRNLVDSVRSSYAEGITDEFVLPLVHVDSNGNPVACIGEGDVVICFNFRTDRCREITQVLTQQDFEEHGMRRMSLWYVTMTNYDDTFRDVKVIYGKDELRMTLGEVLAAAGKRQVRIAETEKYPHVTFFFSGGREEPFNGEKRLLIASPKVPTYDLKPEMSAPEVRDAIIAEIRSGEADFICLNFANPDMVGHTGVFGAIVKAVETIDRCVKEVVEEGLNQGYAFILTADHGNADYCINEDGSPNTAHTTNPVPWFLISPYSGPVRSGILADVAPTVLHLMGIPKPAEMTGTSLIPSTDNLF